MLRGCLGGLALAFMLAGVMIAGGCGGAQEGTLVEVDKEKEAELTKAMEDYYMKNAAAATKKGR